MYLFSAQFRRCSVCSNNSSQDKDLTGRDVSWEIHALTFLTSLLGIIALGILLLIVTSSVYHSVENNTIKVTVTRDEK
jgi:hypothetical protein